MKIFLIGLPGSGKSRLGSELAPTLKIPFVDLDLEIEKTCGSTISSIFEKHGEYFFRGKEANVLERISTEVPAFVMATGGGAPCFHSGIEKMNAAGITIFLDTSVEVIVKRMSDIEKSSRPLLSSFTGDRITDRLKQLKNQRLAFYQKAKIILSEPEIKVEKILARINDSLPK